MLLTTRTASLSSDWSTGRTTFTPEIEPSLPTTNWTITRPSIPFSAATTGYFMLSRNHLCRAAGPPGKEGCSSTTSNTLFSSSCLGGSGCAISCSALSTSPLSVLPFTSNAPIAVFVLVSSSWVFISSSGFTSSSFLMTGAVNLIELLTCTTSFFCSTTTGSFFFTSAFFLAFSIMERFTSCVLATCLLASIVRLIANPTNKSTASKNKSIIDQRFLLEVPFRRTYAP